MVQRIGTADSATPYPDPSGGQAPRLAKSSTALHFLIPPSTIGLQFGTFRRWRAGIEVDWRAHPGSESGTCFRTNNEGQGADYEEYPPADHHAVEHEGVGQCIGYDVWVRWASSPSALELPGHLPECELPTAAGDEGVAHAFPLCRTDAFR